MSGHQLYLPDDPIPTLADEDKVAALGVVDRAARAAGFTRHAGRREPRRVHEVVLIAASDGTLAADVRPLVRMNVSVIVEHNGRREQGYGAGGRRSLASLLEDGLPQRLVQEAVRRATVTPDAVAAPAGTMPVVLGPGWPGVLLQGHRPRARGLQPARHLGFLEPGRRAGCLATMHGGGRRHAAGPARIAQHR